MFAHTRILFGAVLAFAACAATAATAAQVGVDASRAPRVTAEQISHRKLLMERGAMTRPKSADSVASATPALPRINTLAVYPPSCMADPLPDQVSGPSYSRNVSLAAYNGNSGQVDSTEIVTITIWRVACSSSEFFNSATLMRIHRNSNSQTTYPLFPAIRVSQGSVSFNDSDYPENIARVTIEPNTILSDTLVDTPILNDMTFVLENYDSTQTSVFDFNLPFSLRFDNLFASNNLFYIDVPLYDPNSGTYPDAFRDIPISGHLSTSWFTPNSGEGIVMQVYERLNQPNTLVVAFTWSAYAPNGYPVFLVGQVDIPRGARTATAPLYYTTGGSLGGSGPIDPAHPWGTTTVSFPDCNHMTLSYASNPGIPSYIPQGSGSRNWIRLGRLNGLNCE
ncbi:MAG: hypothetical protein IPP82_00745 [Xanthomonadales bacterium]|nr:hypothetical protein [Xanthomonadales bacterium]